MIESMKRGPGRPRKEIIPDAILADMPNEIAIRMGRVPCATSKGVSGPGHVIHHGIVVTLPASEAENLLSLGYATHV